MPQSSAPVAPHAAIDSQQLSIINSRLLDYLNAYPYATAELVEAAIFSVGSRGHRWRPILILQIFEKLDPKSEVEHALHLGCAVEFLHTASLILDDLPSADDATLRRGRKPCHLQFGEARSILTALWLCDVAQHLLHKFSPVGELECLFRDIKNQMMKGQLSDIEQSMLTEQEILEKYRLKSGALYGFAAAAPAHVRGMNDLANHLTKFGNFLGVAYQIADDIHDQIDSAEVLGKDVLKDSDKPTIPSLVGIQRAAEIRDFYKLRAINELTNLRMPIDDLVELVEQICI